MRILIVKPSSFGDIVHLFPALALLRENHPDAVADFVVNPEFMPLLDFSPLPIRRRIGFERGKLGSWRGFLPGMRELLREIRRDRYDFAVDFQGLFRSGFVTGCARAEVRAGFAAPREPSAKIFYNRAIPVSPGHAVDRCGELARKLWGLSGVLRYVPLPENAAGAAELPPLPERFAVLLPGTRWESKRFPPEFFGRLAAALTRRMPQVQLISAGGPAERECAERIGHGTLNLAGTTSIGALLELLRRAEFVAGNDSGPLHAAAALGRPVFGFYGSTDPVLTGPWGGGAGVFSAGCRCAGCLKRICPDGSYRCWELDAESVAAAIAAKLEGGK